MMVKGKFAAASKVFARDKYKGIEKNEPKAFEASEKVGKAQKTKKK